MGDIPNFLPDKQGLPYDNSSWPSYPDKTVKTPFGSIKIGDASKGLCGGMVFAVRDLYEAHRVAPPKRPAGGSPGFNYLVDRLFDSFNIPAGVVEYYEWMNYPAHDTLLGPHGTSWRTIRETMPAVRRAIDSGRPCPLGLVLVHSSDPGMLGENHQVLAWGYEDQGSRTVVKIYDPNYPGDNTITIQFDHTNPAHTTDFQWPGRRMYGFFAVPYSPKNPEPLFE